MAQTPPQLERAIDDILAQARAEIIKFYANGYVGQVIVHVGQADLLVEAAPKRRNAPVRVNEKNI